MTSSEQQNTHKRRSKSVFPRIRPYITATHRWIGVVVCLYFVIWFISGLVLMYVRYPALSVDDKQATLTPINWSRVNVAPGEVLRSARQSSYPQEFWLEMSAAEPVYRLIDWEDNRFAYSAVTGDRIRGVSAEKALSIIQANLETPGATVDYANLDSDQWTVTGYWDTKRPFHRIALHDSEGSEYYVSVDTGEIVLDTERWEKFWNYLGAIPHWIYFAFIRADTGQWFWVVIVLSGVGIVSATSGLILGISRLRVRNRYGGTRVSPFIGWQKWHHIAGIVGGFFLFLWIVTGLLSMYPGGFLEQRGITRAEYENYAGNTTPEFPVARFDEFHQRSVDARTMHFVWIAGNTWAVTNQGTHRAKLFDPRTGALGSASDEQLFAAGRRIMPSSELIVSKRLPEGDEYWHTGFTVQKIPVLRVGFDDSTNTWFHIDPDSGQLIDILDDTGRLDRWANVGVHNVDLHFLFKHRPLWDIVVWILMLAGLFISTSAVYLGVKRILFTSQKAKKHRQIESRIRAGESPGSLPGHTGR